MTGPTEDARLGELFFPERSRFRLSADQEQIVGILAVFALILVPWFYVVGQWVDISGIEGQIKSAIWLAEFRAGLRS